MAELPNYSNVKKTKMKSVSDGTRRNADGIATAMSVIFVWLVNDIGQMNVPIEVLAAFTTLIGGFMARFHDNL